MTIQPVPKPVQREFSFVVTVRFQFDCLPGGDHETDETGWCYRCQQWGDPPRCKAVETAAYDETLIDQWNEQSTRADDERGRAEQSKARIAIEREASPPVADAGDLETWVEGVFSTHNREESVRIIAAALRSPLDEEQRTYYRDAIEQEHLIEGHYTPASELIESASERGEGSQ